MNTWNNLKYKVAEYIPFTATYLAWHMIKSSYKSILDVGCGKGKMGVVIKRHRNLYSVGVDAFAPYVTECRNSNIYNKIIQCDIRNLPFESGSFDVVLCKEVIEHLEKGEAFELLKKLEEIARHKIIVTTPVGRYGQHAYDDNLLQEHKSTWEPDELKKLGYTVRGVGVRKFGGENGIQARWPEFAQPILDVVYVLAGPAVYFLPRMACHMVCQKASTK